MEILSGIAAFTAAGIAAGLWVFVFFGTYWYRWQLDK
jgi:hypothetical protein